jgi:hypothetical protein
MRFLYFHFQSGSYGTVKLYTRALPLPTWNMLFGKLFTQANKKNWQHEEELHGSDFAISDSLDGKSQFRPSSTFSFIQLPAALYGLANTLLVHNAK